MEKNNEYPKFDFQSLDEDNIIDLERWIGNCELKGLIDETNGGIIGYINEAHIDRITSLLNEYDKLKVDNEVLLHALKLVIDKKEFINYGAIEAAIKQCERK